MTAATRKAWEALRERLGAAAANGFAAVEAPGAGEGLRKAWARFTDAGGQVGSQPGEHERFAQGLERYDSMGRQDRSVLVAQGMRLCHSWSGQPPPAKRKPRKPRRRAPDALPPEPKAAPKPAVSTDPAVVAALPPTQAPVTVLPRVGPSTASKLATRGLNTVEDVVFFLPAGYRDHRERKPVAEVVEGEVLVAEVTVERFRQGFARGRFFASAQVVADDGTTIDLRWFHRVGGLGQRLGLGARVSVVGPIKDFRGSPSMVHPEIYSLDEPPPPIGVRYPVVEGVGARTVSNLCTKALARVLEHGSLEDLLPAEVAEAEQLPPLLEALKLLHDPPGTLSAEQVQALDQGRSAAHRRLAFGELFLLQLLLLRRRARWCGDLGALRTPEDAFEREGVRACLPFEPTQAQWRVIDEIEQDLGAGRAMLRLLQGDVGSGKTAVAFAAMRAVVAAGAQAALMAPTEILAEQHLRTLEPWCRAAGLRVALLTGAMPRAQRSSLLALLSAGKIDLLVGTHALLVGDVAFGSLGLVVIDEQHRFGVEQRALLRAKGQRPHLLVMTATPIPRTLALTAYGELEVSVIDTMPPGREPPITRLLAGKPALNKARATVAKAVRRGAQAFVVCPLVEASEALIDVSHVEASAEALRALLPDVGIGIVHGRMSSEDKDAVMTRFREGQLQVLVATTVIEVGVDVPSARAILIEHAERFGLAQLHQLRGRIGRGGGASLCLIHTAQRPSSESAQRLSILTETSDGFAVAERDLALRGPGEIFGTRQAGVPRLRFLGFAGDGTRMLLRARAAAAALLAKDPQLSRHPRLRAAMQRREDDDPVYSADAG
ncbi:MAG: ATP-dependent DNA helicase RecG [Deltaproteobacteria bacterium]|nr:ATP-dependent DNA helicase RecG [Deltaproteobacteria bacterium]